MTGCGVQATVAAAPTRQLLLPAHLPALLLHRQLSAADAEPAAGDLFPVLRARQGKDGACTRLIVCHAAVALFWRLDLKFQSIAWAAKDARVGGTGGPNESCMKDSTAQQQAWKHMQLPGLEERVQLQCGRDP